MTGNMMTPWGTAHTIQRLGEGIFWVKTYDRGGLLIECQQAAILLSDKALRLGKFWERFVAFEQDVAMTVVFYEHPEFYPWMEEELTSKLAEDYIRKTYPEYFAA